jgi:hypothetical protein
VKKRKLEKKIRKLEMSMELSVSLLSVLMDHIDMKRHRKILTREEMLSRGGIDVMLEEKNKEIEEIKKLAQQEEIDYRQAIFRYRYEKNQDECRANIKELEKMWEAGSFGVDS